MSNAAVLRLAGPVEAGGQAARGEGGQPSGEAFDVGRDLVLGAVR